MNNLNGEIKWNESGFRPPLCTYRLNWARRTSWGWWDDWDDTVLQTQDSKFEPWRSEAEHATSRSRRLPAILTFTRGWGRNIFLFLSTAETGNRTPDSGVKGSGANHYPRAPAHLNGEQWYVPCSCNIGLCNTEIVSAFSQMHLVRMDLIRVIKTTITIFFLFWDVYCVPPPQFNYKDNTPLCYYRAARSSHNMTSQWMWKCGTPQ